MLFHTWLFLFFFLATYPTYLLLLRTRYWVHWLLVASYCFYAAWSPLYLLLIVYSTALDYYVVLAMGRSQRRMAWLWISVCNNLFLLGFFKYAGFVTANLNWLLQWLEAPYQLQPPGLLLPVGISFYTFQSMSYTIDHYRGEINREPSFVRFAAFVSLFPQLVAGPIERARSLLPQLREPPEISWSMISEGGSLFLRGLFKKVALANYLAGYVDPIYNLPEQFGSAHLLAATFAFAWQIYFDFSGYTDMARGIARAMGLSLTMNFNNPYLATGLRDFWSRWHISLSSWFRDYVYIPLGGSRVAISAMVRNLFLTMVISGIWHGAAWTFVIWGAVHGLGIVLSWHAERSEVYRRIPVLLKQAVTFLVVCISWVFFRAASLEDALNVFRGILANNWIDPEFPVLALALIAAVWTAQWLSESRFKTVLESGWLRILLTIAMLIYLFLVPAKPGAPFIYFQF